MKRRLRRDPLADRVRQRISRRNFLLAGAAALAAFLQACRSGVTPPPSGGGPDSGRPAPQALAPTPSCGAEDEAEPTRAQTEGPYFTPDSPERTSFRADGSEGTPLLLTGAVLTTGCRPVARGLVDVWHADSSGEYDNRGYRYRGHLFTGDDGAFRLETIVPGLYPGRTRHLHVKVQAPGGRILTTQLYFPDEPANGRDGIFRPELVMAVRDEAGGKQAEFNFVVEA